jgi:hypothetical protein
MLCVGVDALCVWVYSIMYNLCFTKKTFAGQFIKYESTTIKKNVLNFLDYFL